MQEKMFGIDLGTTNSAISVYISKNVSEIITLKESDGKTYNTMPSCVLWLGGDNWVVGRDAYINRYAPNAAYSIKSKIGTDYIHTFRYNGESIQKTPVEISAMILKALCEKAAYLYPEIKKVTITVPAEFGDKERKDTKDAGILAGLDVVDIINEPTSAALRYEVDTSKEMLIYDLGGGTFDLTHLKVTAVSDLQPSNLDFTELGISLPSPSESQLYPHYDVIASGGNRKLGGDDLDKEVLDIALANNLKRFKSDTEEFKLLSTLSYEQYEKLKLKISVAKNQLCSGQSGAAQFEMKSITGKDFIFLVTSDDFLAGTEKIFKKTKTCINRLIAKTPNNKISEIVLIGGSTKNELLRNMIKDQFPEYTVKINMNPDESVALGASIKTAITLGYADISVKDVVPYSFGVGVIEKTNDGLYIEGKVEHLIKRDTPLPTISVNTYELSSTEEDIELKFYTGESKFVENCNLIGIYTVPKTTENKTITITATINTQGLLTIVAKSGNDEITVELNNIKGQNTTVQKPNKMRTQYAARLRRQFKAKGIELTPDLENTLNEFVLTGNAELKEKILSVLDSNNSKTNNFG